MKTTPETRAELRHYFAPLQPKEIDQDVTALLDDLDTALASAEVWKARAEMAERQWQSVVDEASRMLSRDCPPLVVSATQMSVPIETYNEMAIRAFQYAGFVKTMNEMHKAMTARHAEPSKPGGGE